MFCPKCGKEIKENVKFCGSCGAIVNSKSADTTQTPFSQQPLIKKERPPRKKLSKKLIALSSAVVVVIIAIIVSFSLYNRAEAQMNRAISAGNIQEACQIYREKLKGEELSQKSLDELEKTANKVASDYENDDITFEDATSVLAEIDELLFLAQAPAITSDAENRIESLYSYKKYLASAENYYQAQEYLSASDYYKYALEIYPDSEAATEGIAKSEEAYRNDIISQADTYIAERDYTSAENALNTGLSYLQNDTALTNKLNGINDIKIQDIVDDAYSYAQSGEWDSAIELLDDAQLEYKGEATITEAYKDISEKMPITLKNITTISSDHIEINKDVVKDRYGSIYDGAVLYSDYDTAYGFYNLSGKFKTFHATAFVGTQADNGQDLSISIYADNNLVYYQDSITEESAPLDISIDVSEVNTLRIEVNRSEEMGGWSWFYVYFGNSSFEKLGGSD